MKKIKAIGLAIGKLLNRRIYRSWLRSWHLLLFVSILGYAFCLPKPLFTDPSSTTILDKDGRLLGARIARDGQWRFPASQSVPKKFQQAICTFEDKRFFQHPGVDVLAVFRAIWLNIIHAEIRSGGSTLSMQVIRLSRKGKSRTFAEKLVEIILATRLELRHSKEEILNLYASHAPFGGNVVGLETAAWKYYGRSAEELSWSEMCTLAVLPNAPGLIHPGKNRIHLLKKRDFLLGKLLEEEIIDSTTWQLSLLEELPAKPLPLPRYAPHLLEQIHQKKLSGNGAEAVISTTIDREIQVLANETARRHHKHLSQKGIHNLAVLVAEVESGDIMAYVGNAPCEGPSHGCAVDIVTAARSTGSILKPFLFAEMIEAGELLPKTLVPDVPSYFGAFRPSNFSRNFEGAIPAEKALARSLNIPIVHMLKEHGVDKFQSELKSLGMNTLHRPASEYGLTLVLGGAEANLFDLAGMYASLARTLKLHTYYGGKYETQSIRPLNYLSEHTQSRLQPEDFTQLRTSSQLSAASIYAAFEAMLAVSRPSVDNFWEQFSSSQKIAWKTGTSFGFRDAWSIGCTPEYVVAVWVGNADGEGKVGLVGAKAAAPIMFDLFDALPAADSWFTQPINEMDYLPVCKQSGLKPGRHCPETDTLWVSKSSSKTTTCRFHRSINLDPSGQYRVNSFCENPLQMVQKSYFVLPPSQEIFYKRNHPTYESLPDYREDCQGLISEQGQRDALQIIYPSPNAQILIPVELDGQSGTTVFEAVHVDEDAYIYWHLNNKYLGKTKEIHEWPLQAGTGKYTLTLVDDEGHSLSRNFEIIQENN